MSLFYLLTWGDNSYEAASHRVFLAKGGILYDVKAEVVSKSSFFGLFNKTCMEITGKVGTLNPEVKR